MKGTEEANAARFSDLLVKAGFRRVDVRPCQSDPPDFEAEVDGEVWAVEATELHQYVDRSDAEMSRIAVTAPLYAMCERIKRAAAEIEGPACMMTVTGPLDAVTERKVEERALRYIRDRREDLLWLDIDPIQETDPGIRRAHLLVAESRTQAWIEGVEPLVRFCYGISLGAFATNADDERSLAADVAATTNYAVKRVVTQKVDSISMLTNYDKRILLIWSTYPFADPDAVTEMLEQSNLKGVDSVVFSTFEGGTWVVADPGEAFGPKHVLPWQPTE